MLAELYQLSRNLKAQGIEPEPSHADLDIPGIGKPYNQPIRARVSQNGSSMRLSMIGSGESSGLWSLTHGYAKTKSSFKRNRNYFPAIRLNKPILDLPINSSCWEFLKKPKKEVPMTSWKSTVLEIISECSVKNNMLTDLSLKKALTQARRVENWDTDKCAETQYLVSLSRAFALFVSDNKSRTKMLNACVEAIQLATSYDECIAILQIIFGVKITQKEKQTVEYKAQIFLDIESDVAATIYTPKVKLAALTNLTQNADGIAIDLFSQKKGTLLSSNKGTFGKWSAGHINGGIIYNKNGGKEGAPCNARYLQYGSHGLPITTESAQSLVSSLKTATSASRKGINWRAIKNGKFETKNKKKIESSDILIAYPSLKSEQLRWIDPLAQPDRPTAKEQKDKLSRQFETLGTAFIEQLRELGSTNDIKNFIQILCIRQISPGQIQLAYQANPTIKDYKNAIDFWQKSKAGLPQNLRVPLPSGNSAVGFKRFKPHLLFPEDIAKLLSHHWIRDGMQCQKIESPPIGVIFDLFLRNSNRLNEIAAELLELTLTRSSRLMSAAGNALHRSILYDDWKEFHPKNENGTQDKTRPDPRYEFSRTLSLIGTLLYIMKSDPNSPNNRAAFLTGHLLAMADELHKQYSIVVRSKAKEGSDKLKIDMPTTLIGNGLIARAGDNPSYAIADLLDRGRIYIGWAKTQTPRPSSKDQKSIAINSALKVLRKFQPLAAELATHQINKELSNEERAHLFLGYLSPVLGKDAEENDTNNESNQNQTSPKQ